MLKAILYDLGDVFFEAHYWRKWNFEQLTSMSYFKGKFKEFYELYESFLEPVYKGEIKYKQAFMKFLDHLNVPDSNEFYKVSFEKKLFFEQNRILFNGVKETLCELKKKSILNIVITDNESSEIQIRKDIIEKFKINQYIDKVISSKDLRISKTNPIIYKITLDLFELNYDEVLFIAHDKNEIDGAIQVGIKVVEFNNYLQESTDAEYKIEKFCEIIEIIRNSNSK
ncbi:MAG: HAD family hydrolase [Bacteroidales bacterium]|jgi:FMN phosphatase YigB (HAD superfamily)